MSSIYEHWDEEERQQQYSIIAGGYLKGSCFEFAIALHRSLGFPIIGLIADDTIHHAAVKCPDGQLFDARGHFPAAEFGKPFGLGPFNETREITETDLFDDREIQERAINMALRCAEALWPEESWTDSLASKALAYAEEIEEVSRKHGLWLWGGVATCPPLISDIPNEEVSGYTVRPLATIGGFSLHRRLVGEQ